MSRFKIVEAQENELYKQLYRPAPKIRVIDYHDLSVFDKGTSTELKAKEKRERRMKRWES
jgi:hypothetical protein